MESMVIMVSKAKIAEFWKRMDEYPELEIWDEEIDDTRTHYCFVVSGENTQNARAIAEELEEYDRMIVLNDAMDPRRIHPFQGKNYLQEAAEYAESYRKLAQGGNDRVFDLRD